MKARPEHDACLSCALCSSFKYQGPVYVHSSPSDLVPFC